MNRPDDAKQAYRDSYKSWRQDISLAFDLLNKFKDLNDQDSVDQMQKDIDAINKQDAMAIVFGAGHRGGEGVIITGRVNIRGEVSIIDRVMIRAIRRTRAGSSGHFCLKRNRVLQYGQNYLRAGNPGQDVTMSNSMRGGMTIAIVIFCLVVYYFLWIYQPADGRCRAGQCRGYQLSRQAAGYSRKQSRSSGRSRSGFFLLLDRQQGIQAIGFYRQEAGCNRFLGDMVRTVQGGIAAFGGFL